MARDKKNDTALTLEEKLEQALIPDWEWPYKLPKNWCWTKAGYLVKLYRGVSYNKNDAHTEKRKNDCLVMRGGNILEGEINIDADNVYVDKQLVTKEQFIQKSDIIIVSSTGSKKVIGRAGIAMSDYDDIAFGAFLTLLRPIDLVSKRFVGYYFQSDLYRERVRSLAGGVNINNIRAEHITEAPFPLPSTAEQQRIVDRIESLFAKLDEAKEKAQATLDSFETRKAAILHKAFTGELTAKWREQSKITKDSWSEKTLESVCKSIFDGDHMPPPKAASGIHFLVISNVNTGFLSFDDTRFVPKEYYDSLSDTRKPERGDVLYTLVGSFGIPVIVNTDTPFCFQRHMALLKPSSINTTFLWYLLQSQEMYQKAAAMAKGVAQLTVPIKGLRQMKFCCPTDKEQLEIVRLLDQLLIKEREAKESAESVLDQIDLMKKAILSRAFRGELGTNDPTEESALELLKQILSRKATDIKSTKKSVSTTRIPFEIAAMLYTKLEKDIVKLFYQHSGTITSIDEILAVGKNKMGIISTLTNLEQRGIIVRLDQTNYCIKE